MSQLGELRELAHGQAKEIERLDARVLALEAELEELRAAGRKVVKVESGTHCFMPSPMARAVRELGQTIEKHDYLGRGEYI